MWLGKLMFSSLTLYLIGKLLPPDRERQNGTMSRGGSRKHDLRRPIYTDTHIYIIHYIPFHCIPLHCITLHYIALHYIAFHCIALHCITLHSIALHYIALHCIALHCITLHCSTLHYIHTYIYDIINTYMYM